jgi:protein TonB
MTLHFSFPDASKAMREKALDIILVNAKSAKKPTDQQALAQANLDGGGNTDENRRIKTPLPATQQTTGAMKSSSMQRRVQELEVAQQKMLTRPRARAIAAARNRRRAADAGDQR